MNSTDPWTELRRRYPWPTKCPDAPWTEHGWCCSPVREYFRRFLNADTKLIIELGSWLGLSARHMMDIAPNARIICVDHWLGSAEHHRTSRKDIAVLLPLLHERFLKRMWEYRERMTPMRTDIQGALTELADLGFKPQMIYIDGSHDPDSVQNDIETCHKLFPGARLMGDDWPWASVRIGVWHAMQQNDWPIEHNEVAWALKREGEP